MHRHHRQRDSARQPRFQFVNPIARVVVGSTAAIAALCAGAFVFGPFSDLSAMQLAAGPWAQTPAGAPASSVVAQTGRAWGAAAEQRQAAAASAPVARLARDNDVRGP